MNSFSIGTRFQNWLFKAILLRTTFIYFICAYQNLDSREGLAALVHLKSYCYSDGWILFKQLLTWLMDILTRISLWSWRTCKHLHLSDSRDQKITYDSCLFTSQTYQLDPGGLGVLVAQQKRFLQEEIGIKCYNQILQWLNLSRFVRPGWNCSKMRQFK